MKTKIVVDSASSLYALKGVDFACVPLKIITDDAEYLDDGTLDAVGMARTLRTYKGKTSTSCPNVSDWLAAYEGADEVYAITFTGTLSGSYNAAQLAAEEYQQENPGKRVFVLDSLSTGPEQYLLAEHLQSEIEKSLYHEAAGHPALPRGEYQLSQHVGDRCVYTFCMCPGGQVVASASETGHVVTNGMSYHARDGKNANAAVVVSVGAEDFAGDPRRAIAFQRELEAKAYAAGRRGGAYAAPAENVQSFLEGKGQLNIGRVEPTYDRGVVAADLGALLPGELADTLRAGLRAYERKIAGYTAPEAILTGLETRTSSPVRLKREETLESAQLAGLYPCGEGAGYAGGIMSAAVDGLRVARAIIGRYAPAEG